MLDYIAVDKDANYPPEAPNKHQMNGRVVHHLNRGWYLKAL